MPLVTEFQSKVLRRRRSPDEYRVYRAGLEWDLADPIVIENSDDLKSAQRWRDRLEPYHHQVTNLITFCRRLPVTLLADDVGLGKTISAGLILSELIARNRLSKILIVAPKLLGPQWKEELQTKFDIQADIAIGKDLKRADPADTGAVITTYNSARLYLDSIPEDRFQMLILDEAHKLRNLYGVEKTPQVAKRFRHALEMRRFRYVLMLTATPIKTGFGISTRWSICLRPPEGTKSVRKPGPLCTPNSLPTSGRTRANSRWKHGTNSARSFTVTCPVSAGVTPSSTFPSTSYRCTGSIRRLRSWS